VYGKRGRAERVERLPEAVRARAEFLYEEHDLLMGLRREARKALLVGDAGEEAGPLRAGGGGGGEGRGGF
jgi:hypothetical protein